MNMSQSRDYILTYVTANGPVLPSQIAKAVDTNILFASALLSELTASKKLKASTLKVGDSPLYYLPGQESQLEKYSDRLNEKDLRTYKLLKEKKVLRDTELTPLERVSIRAIKDFSRQLAVITPSGEETFWKWHSLSNEDAQEIIGRILNPRESQARITDTPAKPQVSPVHPKEAQKEQQLVSHNSPERQNVFSAPINKSKQSGHEPVNADYDDNFFTKVQTELQKKDIQITWFNIIKKDADIELRVKIPSAVGELEFYAFAKRRKRVNENDLAMTFVKAELKKLPALFITTGEFTKKAQGILAKDFKRVSVLRL